MEATGRSEKQVFFFFNQGVRHLTWRKAARELINGDGVGKFYRLRRCCSGYTVLAERLKKPIRRQIAPSVQFEIRLQWNPNTHTLATTTSFASYAPNIKERTFFHRVQTFRNGVKNADQYGASHYNRHTDAAQSFLQSSSRGASFHLKMSPKKLEP